MLTTFSNIMNGPPRQSKPSMPSLDRQVEFLGATASRAAIAARLFGSFVLLPLVIAQAAATRRRVPCLPPARPPHRGLVPGEGKSIRLLAIGESTVCGIGLASGDEFGRRHNGTSAGAPNRSSDRMARGGTFWGNGQ